MKSWLILMMSLFLFGAVTDAQQGWELLTMPLEWDWASGTGVFVNGQRLFFIKQLDEPSIYYSDDEGTSWQKSASFAPSDLCGDGINLYSDHDYSPNNGLTWIGVSNIGLKHLEIYGAAFLGLNGSTLYAVSNGILRISVDNRNHWFEQAGNGLPIAHVINKLYFFGTDLIADVSNGQTGIRSFFRSQDNGNSWTNFDCPINTYEISTIGSTIYASAETLYYSIDSGITWMSFDRTGLYPGDVPNNLISYGNDLFGVVGGPSEIGGNVYYYNSNNNYWTNTDFHWGGMSGVVYLALCNDYLIASSGRQCYRRRLSEITNVVSNPENVLPNSFILSQNYPNPFNPSTKIQFNIPKEVFVSLNVYNVLGEKIAGLVNKQLSPSTYSVNFDASDLPNGVYFYKIKAGDFVKSKKMILMK